VLDELGIDREQAAHVADAYVQGLGVSEAASRVSDDMFNRLGCVLAGTPEEVVEPLREMRKQLEDLGFDHLVVGVPLGPDVPEALDLLGKEVVPVVFD
jgi:5,10-methylenetetrahydromethanopterin reductase